MTDNRALAGTVSGQSTPLTHAFPAHATTIESWSVVWMKVARRRALCGTRGGKMRAFRIEYDGDQPARFDVGAPRACPWCVAAVRRGEHLPPRVDA